MGIKDLWTILAPFCERRPLYELQGKTVAIDLSCWVCESQNIAEYTVQPRMYLRNLYFRTCYLLLMDVNVVFVLEGKAPELKYKTIAARNALQFRGQKPKADGVKTGKDRSRFHHTLKLCEDMLRLMGIACVQGNGEAEALCAHLNEDGLVDGIISQDSDCFAYGARTVYRNFSISQQGAHAARGGSVDVYELAKAERNLNFGRNKAIALALLCGSDYSDGVYGIGKDSVLKLFGTVSDAQILPRLSDWTDPTFREEMAERVAADNDRCTSCGHPGRLRSHTIKGCYSCGTYHGCEASEFKNERLEIKNELNMIGKAVKDPDFPDQALVKEFTVRKDNVSKLDLEWRKPDLAKFIKLTAKYLTWEEIYSFEKFFPILTRWQLLHPDQIKDSVDGIVAPKFIKKRRSPKGVASYEIVWEDKYGQFGDLIPPEQLADRGDLVKLWSTIEPQDVVQKAHPELVRAFEDSKKPKSRKKKAAVADINDMMKNVSLSGPTSKKTKKGSVDDVSEMIMSVTTKARKRVEETRALDGFVVTSTPRKVSQEFSFDMERSNFGDEDDLEVSAVIDNIMERKLPAYVPEDLVKLGLKLDRNCSFFVNEMTENDLFERTFREYCSDDSDTD